MAVRSRAAKVGDRLVSSQFDNTISHGFAAAGEPGVAVCVLPGTELAFGAPVESRSLTLFQRLFRAAPVDDRKIVTFRQVNKDNPHTHHDALEFPDGSVVMLHDLKVGQEATVLQMPSAPRSAAEAEEQKRAEFVG